MEQLEPQLEGAGNAGKLTQVVDFVTSARHEMDKVAWPTTEELKKSTQMVVVSALVLGAIIGLFDLLLQVVFIDFVASLSK